MSPMPVLRHASFACTLTAACVVAALASCTSTLDLGSARGSLPGASAANTDAAPPAGISLRVVAARQRRMPGVTEPLVLVIELQNGDSGAALALASRAFTLQLASGARVTPISTVPAATDAPWLAGAAPAADATLASGATYGKWPLAFEIDAYADTPQTLHFTAIAPDTKAERSASAAVTLERCTDCDAECTYLSSDPLHCGECDIAVPICENGGPHRWTVLSSGAMDSGLSLWASSTSDVWAGGIKGQAIHWDGTAWKALNAPTTNPIKSMWGSGPNDIWGVGGFGKFDANLVHWDGTAWSAVASGVKEEINAVWGSGPNDVWAVGHASETAHWDGTRWFVPYSEASSYLYAIHGTGARDVWVVGQRGLIRRWDGRAWNDVTSGTAEYLFGVWAASSRDAWAVGDHATVLHWNGNTWTKVAVPVSIDVLFSSIYGSGPSDVWAVGDQGKMIHWNGTAWSKVAMPASAANLVGVTTVDGQAWAVGHHGTASSAEVFGF